MKPKWEYCCNFKMQLADQMLVRDGKWDNALLTSYQCLVCCTYRGWIIREIGPKEWSEPIRIMAKRMRELRANMITCLMYKETRPITHVSSGTKKMSRNTL